MAKVLAKVLAKGLAKVLAKGLAKGLAKVSAKGFAKGLVKVLAKGLTKELAKVLAKKLAKVILAKVSAKVLAKGLAKVVLAKVSDKVVTPHTKQQLRSCSAQRLLKVTPAPTVRHFRAAGGHLKTPTPKKTTLSPLKRVYQRFYLKINIRTKCKPGTTWRGAETPRQQGISACPERPGSR